LWHSVNYMELHSLVLLLLLLVLPSYLTTRKASVELVQIKHIK
jgi:hypothetical protein